MSPSEASLADLLEQCARARADGDARRLVDVARQAGDVARGADDRSGAALADAQRAYGHMRLEENELARDLALAVLPDIDEMGDPAWRIDVRHTATMAMCALSAAADGLPFANAALKIARDNVGSLGRAPISWSLNRTAVVMEELGDTPKAIEIMEQAAEVLSAEVLSTAGAEPADEDYEVLFAAVMNLGILYRNEAERAHDEQHLDRAVELAGQSLVNLEWALELCTGRVDLTVKCLGHHAGVNLVAGRPQDTLESIARLRELAAASDVRHDEVVTTMIEIRALLALGRLAEAQAVEAGCPDDDGPEESLHHSYIVESRIMLHMAAGDFEEACRLSEHLRFRERRIMRNRVELQLRSLLHDAEIQHARLEADWLREQAAALERRAASAMQEALVDPLTGLANRRALEQFFDLWSGAEDHVQLCVAIVDIDHFKRFNDTFGHEVGDAVLCEVAALLGQSTRDGDLVVRAGGEEFVIVMPGCPLNQAAEVCRRLREAVEINEWGLHGVYRGSVTVSVGLTAAVEDDDVTGLLRRADSAMYRAKRAGRNRVEAVELLARTGSDVELDLS